MSTQVYDFSAIYAHQSEVENLVSEQIVDMESEKERLTNEQTTLGQEIADLESEIVNLQNQISYADDEENTGGLEQVLEQAQTSLKKKKNRLDVVNTRLPIVTQGITDLKNEWNEARFYLNSLVEYVITTDDDYSAMIAEINKRLADYNNRMDKISQIIEGNMLWSNPSLISGGPRGIDIAKKIQPIKDLKTSVNQLHNFLNDIITSFPNMSPQELKSWKIDLNFDNAIEIALYLTAMFENDSFRKSYLNGDFSMPYGAVTGNFDSMGMSMGVYQFNFGQGTLQPVLYDYLVNNQSEAIGILGQDKYNELLLVVRPSEDKSVAHNWSLGIQSGNQINDNWTNIFNSLGNTDGMRLAQTNGLKSYIESARRMAHDFNLSTPQGVAMAFDVAIQNGSIKGSPYPGYSDIMELASNGNTEDEIMEMMYQHLVNRGAHKSAIARKEAIMNGNGSVNGYDYDFEEMFGW